MDDKGDVHRGEGVRWRPTKEGFSLQWRRFQGGWVGRIKSGSVIVSGQNKGTAANSGDLYKNGKTNDQIKNRRREVSYSSRPPFLGGDEEGVS